MNINNSVSVVLTAYGADIYNAYYSQFKRFKPAVKSEGDTLKESMWSIMRIFGGSNIGLGMQSPFLDCQLEILPVKEYNAS